MLDKKIVKLLNEQVNAEFYSAYLYLDFANYFGEKGLAGYENWFTIQAQEERDHAMLFVQYLKNNGEKITLEAIKKPDVPLKKDLDALEGALEHEELVTGLIDKIYEAANAAKDFRTAQFLGWFITEQGEEEMNAMNNIEQYKLFGSDPKGLFALDREMGARTYEPPSLVLD